jgi:hypothetical protein
MADFAPCRQPKDDNMLEPLRLRRKEAQSSAICIVQAVLSLRAIGFSQGGMAAEAMRRARQAAGADP